MRQERLTTLEISNAGEKGERDEGAQIASYKNSHGGGSLVENIVTVDGARWALDLQGCPLHRVYERLITMSGT